MPERARAVVLASTGTGDIIPDATVTVRNPGTTVNITDTIFANDDPDTTQLTNGVFKTDARGLAIFYLTNQKRVDVLFTKAGVTSVTIPVDVQKSSLVSGESVATSTIWDAAGDLAKGTGADTAARLARGTANQVLRTNAGGTDIEWGVDPAQDKITTAGDLLYGTAADTAARLGIGTAGQVLKVNSGATAPEWGAAASAALGDLLDWQFVRKTANENVTSSTTLQNDDELFFPIAANESWIFEGIIHFTAHSDGDIKVGFTNPVGATVLWGGASIGITATVNDDIARFASTAGGGAEAQFGGGNATPFSIFIRGIIRNAGTAGNLQLQWAQRVSNATATVVQADSFLKLERVA